MNAVARLTLFSIVLGLVFAASFGVGRLSHNEGAPTHHPPSGLDVHGSTSADSR